jgi:hypothetical protein
MNVGAAQSADSVTIRCTEKSNADGLHPVKRRDGGAGSKESVGSHSVCEHPSRRGANVAVCNEERIPDFVVLAPVLIERPSSPGARPYLSLFPLLGKGVVVNNDAVGNEVYRPDL